jgi:GDP-D-mannose 3',5'-epimerase
MGGMGFIGDPKYTYDVMVGSTQMTLNVLQSAIKHKAKKIFYSSSACVYNENLQKKTTDVSLSEKDSYPAAPDLVYGWQKLFSEQLHQASQDRIDIRIARFHNIYGPEGTYKGGKEKAPAAMCRKAIEANRMVEVWGTGNQTRSFLYIDDCIDAVRLLMQSDFKEPINIGSEEMISINGLAEMAIDISGKRIAIKNIKGPVGVMGRNSNNDLIRSVLGWNPRYTLREGMERTYKWIEFEITKSTPYPLRGLDYGI